MKELPDNWSVWGHFGDGLWRAGRHVSETQSWTHENLIKPQASKEKAIEAACELAEKPYYQTHKYSGNREKQSPAGW